MTRRKDGLWQQSLTVIERGRKKQKYFYGKTKQEVLRKIADYKECVKHGPLFNEVADAWWDEHEKTLSPSTLKSYIPSIRRLSDYFQNAYIADMRPQDISVFLRQEIAQKGFSQKTVKQHRMVVSLIFRYAVDMGFVSVNIARDISIPKGLPKQPRTIPTDDEIAKIKESFETCQMGRFAYWILYTGCRRSELLALRWEDVDFENRAITINKTRYQYNNKIYLKAPKTESGTRVIPLMNALYKKIKPGNGLIFPDLKSGEMIKERRFELDWNRFCKTIGIHCTPHQLRHCYATMLFEEGINVKDAQILLGHAQASTTQDIYTHIREIQSAKIRAKLLDVDIG